MASMPFELVTIGGAAIGVLVAGNSMHDIKHVLGGFKKIFKGSQYHRTDYTDLLSLLFYLVKLAATKGAMALEAHIENADDSPAFQNFPRILANHHATRMVCDYLRMVGMNADDPHQIEDLMARELKKTLNEELHPAHALQNMADGLPALGIVAAVLGVIKTMAKISQPPRRAGRDDRRCADRHVSGRTARLWRGRPVFRPPAGGGAGGCQIFRGHPRRAGRAPAWQCPAGERGNRTQDGAEPVYAEFSGAGGNPAGAENSGIDVIWFKLRKRPLF
jgi:hypothetical protein